MSPAARPIEFWFDFSSPYSYIASEWIEALAARHGRPVRWHAVLLGVTFQAAQLKSPVSHPIKREYSLLDFARSHAVGQILIGRSHQPWWRQLLARSVPLRLVQEGAGFDIHIVSFEGEEA